MRYLPFILTLFLMAQSVPDYTWAHGVHSHNSLAQATVITTLHDDGTPLAFSDFSVFSPSGGPAFAKGQTDSLGRVVFIPTVPGKWEIKIFSDDGHGTVTTVDVLPENSPGTNSPQYQGLGKIQKLITGISILFGIFGLLVLVQKRQPAKE